MTTTEFNSPKHPGKSSGLLGWLAWLAGTISIAAWLFLHFNANGAQSGDSWIAYLPGGIAVERLDLDLLRETLAFGSGRPVLPPALVALVHVLVPGLTWPQASSLLSNLSVVGIAWGGWTLLRTRLGPAWTAAIVLIFLASPAVHPLLIYTTPDMVFGCLCAFVAVGIVRRRAWLVCLAFALAALCRSNAVSLTPALVAFFLLRRDAGIRPRVGYAALCIAISISVRTVVGWGTARSGLLTSAQTQWHPQIFLPDAVGWTLGARLRLFDPVQYFLLAKRIFIAAPLDLLQEFGGTAAWPAFFFGVIFVVAVLGCTHLIARTLGARHLRPELVGLAGGAILLYAPMALFHWETRYMLAVYACIIFAGLGEVAALLPRRVGLGACGLAVSLLLPWTNYQLEQRFPTRSELGLDDSGYEHSLAQVRAPGILSAIAAEFPEQTALIQGCEAMPLPYLNFVRTRDFSQQLRCVGWRFHRDVPASQVDVWIYVEGTEYRTVPERDLMGHAVPIVTVDGHTVGRVLHTEGAPTP